MTGLTGVRTATVASRSRVLRTLEHSGITRMPNVRVLRLPVSARGLSQPDSFGLDMDASSSLMGRLGSVESHTTALAISPSPFLQMRGMGLNLISAKDGWTSLLTAANELFVTIYLENMDLINFLSANLPTVAIGLSLLGAAYLLPAGMLPPQGRLHGKISRECLQVEQTLSYMDSLYSDLNQSAEEQNAYLLNFLRWIYSIRTKITVRDWAYLESKAIAPLQQAFVRFIRFMPLTPNHWNIYISNVEHRIPNPVRHTIMGEVGNQVFHEPQQGLLGGNFLFVDYQGSEIYIQSPRNGQLQVNGSSLGAGVWYQWRRDDRVIYRGQPFHIGIRRVAYEEPQSIWPTYPMQQRDAHRYAFHPSKIFPGMQPQKYVVTRTYDGSYVLRLGAFHHREMVDEVFVAGGWLCLAEYGAVYIDGQTVRFGNIMRDDHFVRRLLITSRILEGFGYRVTMLADRGQKVDRVVGRYRSDIAAVEERAR